MIIKRRRTREVKIGSVPIGANNPIAVQSMTKTKTADIASTIKQVRQLEKVGCDIIRLAVADEADAGALKKIKQSVNVPLVADIHFNWHLALAAIDSGVDKIRLNPGNIYRRQEIKEVVKAAKLARIPIRVGVNSGSLRSDKPNAEMSDAMVKSALDYIRIMEGFGFQDIVVSLKASNTFDTIQAYRKIAKACDYPLHLGVTATGPAYSGIIKSSIAIGSLLLEGIGDTIRVSLTDEPQEEVKVARYILESLGLKSGCCEIISCPTCGRCEADLAQIVKRLESALSSYPVTQRSSKTGQLDNWTTGQPVKIAVMGCMVNGPGEARECDIGVAFAKKQGLLFKAGKPIRKIPLNKCVNVLLEEVKRLCCGPKHLLQR